MRYRKNCICPQCRAWRGEPVAKPWKTYDRWNHRDLRLALEEYRRCRIKPRVKELKYWILQAMIG